MSPIPWRSDLNCLKNSGTTAYGRQFSKKRHNFGVLRQRLAVTYLFISTLGVKIKASLCFVLQNNITDGKELSKKMSASNAKKRKIEQNNANASKKLRGELQTPTLGPNA